LFWFDRYNKGDAGIGGIGGPHIGYGYIWPMSLTMLALTSDDDAEITRCLEQLLVSSAGTGFLHESFNLHDVNDFTRPWFAWANTLFGELVLGLAQRKPHLLFGR
jgi:meiotically up-regulated gene 157 (Mug157) protein